jgi:hypothetical protein
MGNVGNRYRAATRYLLARVVIAAALAALTAAARDPLAAFTFVIFAARAFFDALPALAATFSILAALSIFAAAGFREDKLDATAFSVLTGLGVKTESVISRCVLCPHYIPQQGQDRRDQRGLPVSHQHEFCLSLRN